MNSQYSYMFVTRSFLSSPSSLSFTAIMLTILRVLTQDPGTLLQLKPMNTPAYQETLMLRAIDANVNAKARHPDHFWNYVRTGEAQETDPCTWRGVICSGGIVRRFIFPSVPYVVRRPGNTCIENANWLLELDWLPSTLHAIHLNQIYLIDGCTTESLPRELRYLSLDRSNSHSASQRTVNFRKLPESMEVLHIQSGYLRGPVVLDSIPKTMRVMTIIHISMISVHVDSSALPEGLKRIALSAQGGPLKIKEMSDFEKDSRVFVGKLNEDFRIDLSMGFEVLVRHYRQVTRGSIAQ